MSESEQIGAIHCKTAAEFVIAISEIPAEVRPPDFRNRWVYRGHGNADWELKPAAWRVDGRSKLAPLRAWLEKQFPGPSGIAPTAWHELRFGVLAEVVAITQFCELADSIGLVIPDAERTPTIEDAAGRIFGAPTTPLPDISRTFFGAANSGTNIITPAAYAQHHGVPTRLLDWTRNPLFAAFFAVEGQAEEKEKGERKICVWATLPQESILGGLLWATVPRGHHPYVHAQDGVFSHSDNADEYLLNHRDWPTLLHTPHPRGGAWLRKWTLPASESTELRKLLFARGVSRSRLMPTLDSVGADTRARWDWY